MNLQNPINKFKTIPNTQITKTGLLGFFLSFFLVCSLQAESIYIWIDADGTKRYSNHNFPSSAKSVQIIDELKIFQDDNDQNRLEYDQMVEKAVREADRLFEEQARKKAAAKELAQKIHRNKERQKLEQTIEKLQQEIEAIHNQRFNTAISISHTAQGLQPELRNRRHLNRSDRSEKMRSVHHRSRWYRQSVRSADPVGGSRRTENPRTNQGLQSASQSHVYRSHPNRMATWQDTPSILDRNR